MTDKIKAPNEDQVVQADAILQHHTRNNGMHGNDGSRRRTIFSMFSVLTGIGGVAEEFHAPLAAIAPGTVLGKPETPVKERGNRVYAWAMQNGDGFMEIVGENPYGFAVGSILEVKEPLPADVDPDDKVGIALHYIAGLDLNEDETHQLMILIDPNADIADDDISGNGPKSEDDLEDKNVPDLKKLAKELEIEGASSMNKADLVAAIRAAKGSGDDNTGD